MEFILDGKPKAKNRVRFVVRNKSTRPAVHTYSNQTAKIAEDREQIWYQMGKLQAEKLTEGPLHVKIRFFMPIAKKNPSKISENEFHSHRPDVDNMAKYYLDVMNDVVYTDDCLISFLDCAKIYSSDPRTEISVNAINENDELKELK